ncbi:MAG: indole-3-glycerol phosphate synthase TrpC [Solobacterium sp.]|nr:indole-3-glycerol phosphate synthase TrpC [Solobacterium sp.]
MDDILRTIADYARERVKQKKEILPEERIRELALASVREKNFPFETALREEGMSFICECKKASPSKGLIDPDFDYLRIARQYEEAGAAAISCLTEPKWFLGKDEYLREIAEEVSIPVLRKDFTVDEYMIYEAKLLGASAVLLIVSLLSEAELNRMREIADSLGLSALFEAHDREEIETALRCGARVIGVNNRNLHDFTVDIHNSVTLRNYVPPEVLFTAESGIKTREDIAVLEEANVNAVLIGETLMRSENKKAMLRKLKGDKA